MDEGRSGKLRCRDGNVYIYGQEDQDGMTNFVRRNDGRRWEICIFRFLVVRVQNSCIRPCRASSSSYLQDSKHLAIERQFLYTPCAVAFFDKHRAATKLSAP